MKKALVILISILATSYIAMGCPVCERNQPKALKGIVHGSGPESNWDYVGVSITGVIASLTLIFSVKWLIKPGEKNTNHIKYSILQ